MAKIKTIDNKLVEVPVTDELTAGDLKAKVMIQRKIIRKIGNTRAHHERCNCQNYLLRLVFVR